MHADFIVILLELNSHDYDSASNQLKVTHMRRQILKSRHPYFSCYCIAAECHKQKVVEFLLMSTFITHS